MRLKPLAEFVVLVFFFYFIFIFVLWDLFHGYILLFFTLQLWLVN